jgi:hypothetical protein
MQLRQIRTFVIASISLYDRKYHREFFYTIVRNEKEILTDAKIVIFPIEILHNEMSIEDLLKGEVQVQLRPSIHSSISSNSMLLKEIGDSVYTSELIELEFEELTPFKESLERLFSLVIGNTKNLYLKEKVEVYKNIELEWE